MSVLFEKRRLGAAPAWIARPSSARLPLPTVLWFHGFTAGKATAWSIRESAGWLSRFTRIF